MRSGWRSCPTPAASSTSGSTFRVRGAAGQDCVLRIENAGGATYTDGWKGYRACASEDGEDWLRVATDYDGTVLTIRHRPAGDAVRFAYFAPYPMARHDRLIARAKQSPLVTARRSAPPSTARRSTSWRSAGKGSAPAGSSGASIPARPWPSGGWRGFWSGCSTRPTRWRKNCWRRRGSSSCPT